MTDGFKAESPVALPEKEEEEMKTSPPSHTTICMSNSSPLHWQSARPGSDGSSPDSRVVSDSSRTFTIERDEQLKGLPSHRGSSGANQQWQ